MGQSGRACRGSTGRGSMPRPRRTSRHRLPRTTPRRCAMPQPMRAASAAKVGLFPGRVREAHRRAGRYRAQTGSRASACRKGPRGHCCGSSTAPQDGAPRPGPGRLTQTARPPRTQQLSAGEARRLLRPRVGLFHHPQRCQIMVNVLLMPRLGKGIPERIAARISADDLVRGSRLWPRKDGDRHAAG
jgi:hypothetical protein